VDFDRLRRSLEPIVLGLTRYSHGFMTEAFRDLGIVEAADAAQLSKTERARAVVRALSDGDLPSLAKRCLVHGALDASLRYQIEELLSRDDGAPRIPKKYRRELACTIDAHDLYEDRVRFDALLGRLFVLDDDPLASAMVLTGGDVRSLRSEIERHVHRNRGDWATEYLFDRLGAYDCSDRRFALLLEGLVSSEVRPNESSQRRVVARMNETLRGCGIELRETGDDGGYPVFSIVSIAIGSSGRPKNLIFASSVKPDLRFRDAVNNDIEIVSNSDRVLVYDRPIGSDGLRWTDLQDWWASRENVPNDEAAKKSLYRRLAQSLPDSPPQRLLFKSFFESYSTTFPRLPALLPEVWLHWDHKTVEERGAEALARFRMDFLLLLPHNTRVVLEVDGKRHYADASGRACPATYTAMVAADRDLRLAGYEVFHFGTSELDGDSGKRLVAEFFTRLFARFGFLASGR
jgi:hypothetical protein